MKFSIAVIVAAATAVFAAPAPAPQLSICFDDFDCILSGFNCVNFQCVQPSGSATSSSGLALPTGLAGLLD